MQKTKARCQRKAIRQKHRPKTAPPRAADPATQYAQDVVAGRILAGRPVRLACRRHLHDLKDGSRRGLRFDIEAAQRAIDFFGFLTLAEGQHAGKPFVLEPFQQFIVGSLFGWKGADGFRRFRTAYIEIGKGNGKSPLAAGIGLYGLVADDEQGAEIYSAAVTRDQARILFRDAENMVEASPGLRDRVERHVGNLSVDLTHSFFRPVSSEHRGLDGKRVHMGLIDELHEHPTAMVVDKIRAGTKGRRQALIVLITNSGKDRHSVCRAHHEMSLKVLDGLIENDSWFGYVCQLDICAACRADGKTVPTDGCKQCDDWRNPKVWIKANPCLGVSVTEKYLREQISEAIAMPSKENLVKRLNCCIWTEQTTRWMPMAAWDQCNTPVRAEQLLGRPCYAGLDLASTTDLAALVLVFPDDEGFLVLPYFWAPEERAEVRERKDRVPYLAWAKQGLLTLTPGNVTDYDVIRDTVKDLAERYQIREIAIDRWNATQLATQLQTDGATVCFMGQGYASMNAPMKELEKLVLGRQLAHGGHPILRWMAANVAAEEDAAGNIKPSKEKSGDKIDGIVALIMGLARAGLQQGTGKSVYEERGVLTV